MFLMISISNFCQIRKFIIDFVAPFLSFYGFIPCVGKVRKYTVERRGFLYHLLNDKGGFRFPFLLLYSNLIDVPCLSRVVDVGAKEVDAVKPLLRDLPDIIVGTPGRLAQHLKYVFY